MTKLIADLAKAVAVREAVLKGDDVAFSRAMWGEKAARAVQLWQDGKRSEALSAMRACKHPDLAYYEKLISIWYPACHER